MGAIVGREEADRGQHLASSHGRVPGAHGPTGIPHGRWLTVAVLQQTITGTESFYNSQILFLPILLLSCIMISIGLQFSFLSYFT